MSKEIHTSSGYRVANIGDEIEVNLTDSVEYAFFNKSDLEYMYELLIQNKVIEK